MFIATHSYTVCLIAGFLIELYSYKTGTKEAMPIKALKTLKYVSTLVNTNFDYYDNHRLKAGYTWYKACVNPIN